VTERPEARNGADRGGPAQLLIELVTNPRDPGYEAAAAQRGGEPSRRWYDAPLIAVGCAVIGFVLVLAYVHTHRAAPEAAKVRQSLIARVHTAESRGNALAGSARALNDELNTLRANALAGSGALTDELNEDELLAGQVAVHGPGLQVELAEPPAPSTTAEPGRGGTVPITATHILSDRDVRSVVNQLWADGAEAVSVNDVRLTPTSAIRFAGQAVLVDFQPISSPYTIRAIGPADQLVTAFASSPVASRYQTLASAEGIGFTFGERDRLTLPASPAAAPRYAKVPTATKSKGTR
jgi:uncharacterized protein YlxW (UPF0749 family)